MNSKKAPGIDHFASDICHQFTMSYPKLITDFFNRSLTLQHFPKQWKMAYVKIIPKPSKKEYGELGSFLPIGLLPMFGKLLEKLFIKKVTHCASQNGKINRRQFGFREQTNSIKTINTALDLVQRAKENKQLAEAISLDIKAAFDSAWWPALFNRLRYIACPNNIFGLIRSYFQDRVVILDHAGERVKKTLSRDCIQGSTCGPALWNIILDELLYKKFPEECHAQALADDFLLIITADNVHKIQTIANQALSIENEWGTGVKLTFGHSKTQMLAFTPKAKSAQIEMAGYILTFKQELK
ncbi:unnamed protein product [Parnassius mnemosyne]|uniref:Reverse transcriptase domain-containing protein n=1 Tax=Parnassius mnemosyne TaxID=213953 RepID=A0AAV1KQD5_9NEOP